MRLSHLTIRNFRNFHKLDVALGSDLVVVGENSVGKSNLLHALRLVLDPQLPESARQLRREDFWDGLPRPLKATDKIKISVEITDFDDSEEQFAVLGDHIIGKDPITARLTYLFQKSETVEGEPTKDSDYEFVCYGAGRPENEFGYEIRSQIPLSLFPALRDAENDIANWRRSPLRPLLDRATGTVDRDDLIKVAANVAAAGSVIGDIPEIKQVSRDVNARLRRMVGEYYASDIALGIASSDPDRLIRALRIFIDESRRGIAEASLGSANLLYLALMTLEFENLASEGGRAHTFLAIEEPEAHLHPHLQRLVFRDFLRTRSSHGRIEQKEKDQRALSVLLTTHSPHIASVAPLDAIVMLRKSADGSTAAYSAAKLGFEAQEIADIERYLDVTRGEMLFGRAVILVEGDAELYLVPVLARLNGVDLEELGVTVCSVGGTNFEPYVQLLGPSGLNVPFAVITDGDPDNTGERIGYRRVKKLFGQLVPDVSFEAKHDDEVVNMIEACGLFVGNETFELDLFKAGRHRSVCRTITELTKSNSATERASMWSKNPGSVDRERLIRDIEAIGKGRFAQRLATHLNNTPCPEYVRKAFTFIKGTLS